VYGLREDQRLRRVGVLGLLGVLVWLLAACAGPAARVAPQPASTPTVEPTRPEGRGAGATLRILFWQAPKTLNPHLTTGSADWAAARVTYEPLASYDAGGSLVPFLAAEIPSLENGGVAPDGKSVTWKLKHDVRWSDGEPFTAEDVRFTYDFIKNPDTGATTSATYSAVDSVEVIDDYTVRVNFKQVTPAWSLPFVGVQGLILPKHIFGPYNGANAAQAPANLLPVGTGPYRVVKFKPEEVLFLGNNLIETNKIVYEPNPFFREPDKPYFNRVELKGGGTVGEAARSVLQVGDVDYANNLQIDAATQQKLEAGGKGKILAPFGAFVERILLNRTDPDKATAEGERSSVQFSNPFFDDPKVRQAFAFAVDRDAIAKLYGSTGTPTSNVLVSPDKFQSPNTSYEFNLDKAAGLLDEAGWVRSGGDGIRTKDGVKLSVLFQTSANPLRQQTQAIVKKALESIGVDVQLTFFDSSVFFDTDPNNVNNRHHFYADMEMYATGNRSPDPGAYMKSWTCAERAQKANNWTGLNKERWCDPAYDALYQQSTQETDPEKRRQLFIQMNDMLVNDQVVIPLVRQADISGVSNTLEGVTLTPWDADLWNIKDWRRAQP
jgi:peptide/nickel transport system substrate-binding protein